MVKCWSSIHWVCFAIWWERQHCRLVAKAMICNDFRKLYNHLSSTLVFETDTLLALLTICEFSHLEHQVNNCVIRRIWVGLIPDEHSKATYSAEDYSACCKDSYVFMLTPWQCMFWSSSPAWQPILRSGRSSLWSVVVPQAQNGEVVLTCFNLKNLAMSNVVAKKQQDNRNIWNLSERWTEVKDNLRLPHTIFSMFWRSKSSESNNYKHSKCLKRNIHELLIMFKINFWKNEANWQRSWDHQSLGLIPSSAPLPSGIWTR